MNLFRRFFNMPGWYLWMVAVYVMIYAAQVEAATAYFVREVVTGSTKQCVYLGPVSRTHVITVDWIRPCPRSITVPDMF